MRTLFGALAALAWSAGPASALTSHEIVLAREFEGQWGLVSVVPKAEVPYWLDGRSGCGEMLARNIRVLPDQYEATLWRLYSTPSQSLGDRIVSVTTDGTVQRITVESFAPIGHNTNTYERSGDTLVVTLGAVRLTYKRC